MTFPRPIIRALLEAIGESDTLLGGHLETFLRGPLAWDDDEIAVAATERWPDPGLVDIDGEAIEVTTKDATTFTITSRPKALPSTPTASTGARVVDIKREYSDLDIARKQMLTKYATGAYLTAIATNYGVPRPSFKGRPLVLTDDQFRDYLQVVAFLRAGPLWGIMRVLEAMFPATILSAATDEDAPTRLLFGAPLLPGGCFGRGLVRIAEDWSRVHRIIRVDPSGRWLDLSPVDGPTWAAADFDTVANPPGVQVELLPWDVWERADRPGEFFIELYQSKTAVLPWGATYLHGGEEAVSVSTTSVITLYPINQVLGVFLATDPDRTGTNYFTGGSFAGQTITLGSALPSPNTAVLVDYGSIDPSTAQLLQDITVENDPAGEYWPFYLTDYAALLTESGVLDIIRALGMLPVVSSCSWGSSPVPAEEEETPVLFSGVTFTRPTADVVRLTPAGARDRAFIWVHDGAGDWVLVEVASPLDCDFAAAAGAGALQSGDSYTADTGYQIVLIAKGTLGPGLREPALIAMVSGTDIDPNLPAGYTHWSKVISFASAVTGPDLQDFEQYENRYFYRGDSGINVENAYKANTSSATNCSKAVPYEAVAMLQHFLVAQADAAGPKSFIVDDADDEEWYNQTQQDGDEQVFDLQMRHRPGTQPEVNLRWAATVTTGGASCWIRGFLLRNE